MSGMIAGKMRTTEEIHGMARYSAKAIIEQKGPLTRQQVSQFTGLCELSAAKALKELVDSGEVEKLDDGCYILT